MFFTHESAHAGFVTASGVRGNSRQLCVESLPAGDADKVAAARPAVVRSLRVAVIHGQGGAAAASVSNQSVCQ